LDSDLKLPSVGFNNALRLALSDELRYDKFEQPLSVSYSWLYCGDWELHSRHTWHLNLKLYLPAMCTLLRQFRHKSWTAYWRWTLQMRGIFPMVWSVDLHLRPLFWAATNALRKLPWRFFLMPFWQPLRNGARRDDVQEFAVSAKRLVKVVKAT